MKKHGDYIASVLRIYRDQQADGALSAEKEGVL